AVLGGQLGEDAVHGLDRGLGGGVDLLPVPLLDRVRRRDEGLVALVVLGAQLLAGGDPRLQRLDAREQLTDLGLRLLPQLLDLRPAGCARMAACARTKTTLVGRPWALRFVNARTSARTSTMPITVGLFIAAEV